MDAKPPLIVKVLEHVGRSVGIMLRLVHSLRAAAVDMVHFTGWGISVSATGSERKSDVFSSQRLVFLINARVRDVC